MYWQVALWYRRHLDGKAKVILLTNDKGNAELAQQDSDHLYSTESLRTYVERELGHYPELIDRLAIFEVRIFFCAFLLIIDLSVLM